jgi:hypothetical protein
MTAATALSRKLVTPDIVRQALHATSAAPAPENPAMFVVYAAS